MTKTLVDNGEPKSVQEPSEKPWSGLNKNQHQLQDKNLSVQIQSTKIEQARRNVELLSKIEFMLIDRQMERPSWAVNLPNVLKNNLDALNDIIT